MYKIVSLTALLALCCTLLFACVTHDANEKGSAVTHNANEKGSALWHTVHDRCVQNQQRDNNPGPCESVNLAMGYAVLKDTNGKTQFLVIPTQHISGIESPEVLAENAPNYWQAAWEARIYVFRQIGHELPRDDIGLAINSPVGRTQNQLHIHIDCLAPEVIHSISKYQEKLDEHWSYLPFTLSSHHYQARRVNSADLRGVNPFQLLADGQHDMKRATLVVAGVLFAGDKEGFVLLADIANSAQSDKASGVQSDKASGEELLDHSCAVANVK